LQLDELDSKQELVISTINEYAENKSLHKGLTANSFALSEAADMALIRLANSDATDS